MTEYLEPFREEMESITDSLRGFMRSMDQTSALTNLLGSVFKKSGGSVQKWEESVGGYAAVFSGLVSQLAQGGGLGGGFGSLLGGGLGLVVGAGSPQAGLLGASLGGEVGSAIADAITGNNELNESVKESMSPESGGVGPRRLHVRNTHNHIGQVVIEVDAVLSDHNPDIEKIADELGQRLEQELHKMSV